MNRILLLQLLLAEMERYGAEISFERQPQADSIRTDAILQCKATAEAAALDAIAACLREDTDDFTCIDRIIAVLEPLGYVTVRRHDFG